jgi:hypothetical protein
MEISTKNQDLLRRKHFLLRAIEHGNVDKISAENEVKEIDKKVALNTLNKLNLDAEKLKADVNSAKITIKQDGPLKRQVASILIKFLDEQDFSNDEVKGIMRQGYKTCRYR